MLLYLRCEVKKKVRVDNTLSAGMHNFLTMAYEYLCVFEKEEQQMAVACLGHWHDKYYQSLQDN